jgi:uncharacterized protein (DUF2147 family)
MKIQKPKLLMLGFLLLLLGAANSPADMSLDTSKLEGQWKMSDKPILIEIKFSLDIGQGKIIAHDNDPSAVGKLLLSDIVKDSDHELWDGFIYVPQLSRTHPMKLVLVDDQRINVKVKVGFIRKTVTFLKVDT